ncbi:hypothetical protein ZWY2020_044724 [Hordeum vulgare]|nr:hypothetical protein ZWY2020_044724 [Hordeum vulgare]
MLDDAVPLTSRHGLLLLRLAPRGGAPAVGTSQTLVHLAVCNLLVGTCDALPPLESNASSSINNCAILTGADRSLHERRRSPLPGRSSLFKVLVIVFDRATSNYNLCTFSSTKSTWSKPTLCFSKTAIGITEGSAAVRRGTAHWFACDGWEICRTLDVNTKTGRPSLTEVVIPHFHTSSIFTTHPGSASPWTAHCPCSTYTVAATPCMSGHVEATLRTGSTARTSS